MKIPFRHAKPNANHTQNRRRRKSLQLEAMEVRAMLSGRSVFNSQYWHQDAEIQDVGEELDQFGFAVATGDFDGDDFLDLAVGVPGESVDGNANSGAVNVIYGTRDGLAVGQNQFWTQQQLTDSVHANARVGAALASGDFNGDDIDDLAIGIPGATIETNAEAGGVAVLFGIHNQGLSTVDQQFWHQNVSNIKGTSNPGDHFGAALAAGDFNSDRIDDLAIGVPNDEINGKAEAGGVAVLYGVNNVGLDTAGDQYLHQDIDEAGGNIVGDAEVGDHFGTSLTTGDFDGNGSVDLAIGVPDDEINNQASAGGVNVLYSTRGTGLTTSNNQFWHQDVQDVAEDAEVGDSFGEAIVAGNFDGDNFADLAIGVPGENLNGVADAGAVHILSGSGRGLAAQGNQLWHQNLLGIQETAEVNDRFGAALSAADFQDSDDVDELVVGAPGETLDGLTGVGVITMLPGTRDGLTDIDSQTWRPSDLGLPENIGEQFGSSLAAGDFDFNRFPDLAIGIPLDTPVAVRSGAVAVMYGTLDTTSPSVTINQAPDQADPTSEAMVSFAVEFSEPVTGFTGTDVVIGGTAGATTATVTGAGAFYRVTVTDMIDFGTVTASISAGAAFDTDGNPSLASVSTDNTVSYVDPDQEEVTVTINKAADQEDPTSDFEIRFAVEFSQPVTGFTSADVQLGGTAGATTATVTGSGAIYQVRVSGMTESGTVIASIPADVVSPVNLASTSTDNSVEYFSSSLTVTINQAADQDDPTRDPTVRFDVRFSKPVVGFTGDRVEIRGTAFPLTAIVTGSGTSYSVAVSGMAASGTVFAFIPAGVVVDSEGSPNQQSGSTDNTVNYIAPPTVTINQATSQEDPTSNPEIRYTVRFSEPVTEFTAADVDLDGTAGANNVSVSGSGANYEVLVSGMTQAGTVLASIPANVVVPLNAASTSRDNIVSFEGVSPPAGWTNLNNPLDVTNDGFVSPIDVLRIINEINNPTVSDALGQLNPIGTAPPNPPGYLDVTGDGFVTARDALQIVIHINNNPVLAAALAYGFEPDEDKNESDQSD